MQSRSTLIEHTRRPIWPAVCCLTLIFTATNFQLGDAISSEPFHHGEALAAALSLAFEKTGFYPLTIHGALDFIPALIARTLFGQEKYFFPTWFIYQLISFFAAITSVAVIAGITRKTNNNSGLILLASALMAPALVGYKDAVLLPSIYLYLLIQRQKSPATRMLLEVCFGVVMAFGLFWSFDRGIAAAVSLGAACIIFACKDRTYIVSFGTFIATLILLGLVSHQFSLEQYWGNIKILLETSSQWSYGWKDDPVILTGFLGFANALALWLLFTMKGSTRFSDANFPNLVFLTGLSIFLFKMGSNRADVSHIVPALWGPLLIAVYWYSSEKRPAISLPQKIASAIFLLAMVLLGWEFEIWAFIPMFVLIVIGMLPSTDSSDRSLATRKAISATLLVAVIGALYAFLGGISSGAYKWIVYFKSPPSNTELATDGVRWASEQLLKAGSTCVFDMSNNGVINGLSGLPSCSRFVYPVYANQRYQQEIIDSLESRLPPAIVYSSTYWSYSIDGKAMPARFPALNDYLLRKYGNQKCSFGYCIRYLTGGK